jgi:hypothetical protein
MSQESGLGREEEFFTTEYTDCTEESEILSTFGGNHFRAVRVFRGKKSESVFV